ncbi:MAG: hypothetical protein R3321_13960, partial [Nitrososphaeraceae archaeon]|nr:hypothetical protein [Nitrososphaeraceae archaeon]
MYCKQDIVSIIKIQRWLRYNKNKRNIVNIIKSLNDIHLYDRKQEIIELFRREIKGKFFNVKEYTHCGSEGHW